METPLYVLILAGGSGERFWPLSRKSRPKQLLSLFSERTLLEDTIARLDGLVPPENILILTNQDQIEGVRSLATMLPAENIIAEPAKRDTASAIALGAALIALRNPQATMIVLPADHLIQNVAEFQNTLRVAAAAAGETGDLVTIGIKPTWACPGFGYIEMGKTLKLAGAQPGDPAVHEVGRFREKPNRELAETFLQSGNFRWNAGMFIWKITALREVLVHHAPVLEQFVNMLLVERDVERALSERFAELPKISIDYAVMEKAERVVTVEATFDWDDVGSWTAIAKYFPVDEKNNRSNTELSTHFASNNIVFSQGKLRVALMGVNDLIVVQTDDAILVCHREEAERIKQIVGTLPERLQ
jgi:mannose-1-phosphate guanylyltransferase